MQHQLALVASIKRVLKAILPRRVIRMFRTCVAAPSLSRDAYYDMSRYSRYSTAIEASDSAGQVEAWITAAGHVLEKAMSLPEPRLGFGQPNAHKLLTTLQLHRRDERLVRSVPFQSALGAVGRYLQFHEERDYALPEIQLLFDKVKHLNRTQSGGTRSVRKSCVQSAASGDFESVAFSRSSVRTYSGEAIERDTIERAVAIAQTSPSVCNRQSSRVYVVADAETKLATLALQNGNRGFGHTADTILVVTSDLESYFGSNERHQAYIDGGLFSMSLLLSLHFLGLGACPLAWCVVRQRDDALRRVLPIRDSEVVVMFIAVGHLREEFEVATSTRRHTSEILRWVESRR